MTAPAPAARRAGGLSFGAAGSYREPVRAEGLLSDPALAVHADHVCWIYDDVDAFGPLARRYLAEGLARGERLLYVGDPAMTALRGAPGELADVDGLVADGVLHVLDVGDAYEGAGEFAPEQQLAFYQDATRRAVADGYRGLRVVAELSGLAADPGRRADLLRWEHLADDFIGQGSGMVALCAYGSDLDPGTLADVATVHPQVHAPDGGPPFRIWFDDGALRLAGALDAFGAERLRRVLAESHVGSGRVVADLTRVEFVDVGGCRALAGWARQLQDGGARLELVGTTRVFRRMWEILGFADLVEVSFREAAE